LSIPVVVLFGPTASGKTEVVERLFSLPAFYASVNGFELISADSMQVYRGMNIGTAKPRTALLEKIPHHLIDIREPSEQFNAGDFVRLADEAAAGIAGCGRLPVISGGTGFYINNFINGLPDAPPSDHAVREELKAELFTKGAAALQAELAACDSLSAARIHINDTYRLLRALEVYRLSGRPLSSFNTNKERNETTAKYTFFIAGLLREREDLYRRIDKRCSQMFKDGLYEEVKTLFNAGWTPDCPALKAIGYKEFFYKNENGEYRIIDGDKLGAVEELVAKNSRNYAKRQITWFKNRAGAHWYFLDSDEKSIATVSNTIKEDITCFFDNSLRAG
jgi:tRNA dimethylallyltransferase